MRFRWAFSSFEIGLILVCYAVGDEVALRVHNPPLNDRQCVYRGQKGFCQRRSQCRRPSGKTCRFGATPIICCLDEPEKITSNVLKRKRRNNDGIDITFPRCGKRTPIVNKRGPNRAGSRPGRSLRSQKANAPYPTEIIEYLSRERRGVIKPVIVGGKVAKANSWPWMVALFKIPGRRKRFICGASLISRKFVLTAAHCFDGEGKNSKGSDFLIIVGSQSTNDGTEYPVKKVIIHSEYKESQSYNDIALLELAAEVELTNKVYPVCLPSSGLRSNIKADESMTTVTGWGDTSFDGMPSKELQEVTVPIVSLKECNASYAKFLSSVFPHGITDVFICAGLRQGGKDACQGDSGGPMVLQLQGNTWVQLGVVSFGYGCGQAGTPGIYTRLSKYTRWIYDNTDLG